MFGYIYETINLINGKKYIGQKKSNMFLGNKYLGSGTRLHLAIKKYGEENFTVKLIEECNSEQELNEREIYWIEFYNATTSENYYNISIGGDGGDTTSCNPNKNEIIQKRSNKLKGLITINNGVNHKRVSKNELNDFLQKGWVVGLTQDYVTKMHENNKCSKGCRLTQNHKDILSKKFKGKSYEDLYGIEKANEMKLKSSISHSGYVMPDSQRQKISENNKGKHSHIKSEETRKKISESNKGRVSPMKGKKFSNESKQSMSKAHLGKKLSDETKEKMRKSRIGLCYINNDVKCIKVKKEELQLYLNDGWKRGMLKR